MSCYFIQFFIGAKDPIFCRNLNFALKTIFRSELWVLNIIINNVQLVFILVILNALGYAQIWLQRTRHDVKTKRKQVAVEKIKRYENKVFTHLKCFRQIFTVYVIKLHVWLNVFPAKSKEYLIAILSSQYILSDRRNTHRI